MLEGVEPDRGRYRAWADEPGDDTLDALIERGATKTPPKPKEGARITILTSGTTGTPKGAPRSEPKSLGLLGGLLSKVPFRAREVTELAVPMFHALGFAQAMVALGLGSTLVVRRKFDPEKTLDSMAEHKATALVVVPVMLSRIVDLGEEKIKERDLSALKIIFISGSARRRGSGQEGPQGVRAGHLQPLRLDRDRLRDDRHPGGPRGRAEHGRQGRPRLGGQDLRRRGQARGQVGRDRPHLRRQPVPVRGLHRWRQQGHGQRADGLRRRRPLRRGRAPVHRRPRRRDDRLGRRERVPGRGRGVPGQPRVRSRRPRPSGSTTRSSASA